jgi:hypothetical protein
MIADLIYNLKYWSPRAALLITGLILLVVPTRLGSLLRSPKRGTGGSKAMRYIVPATGVTALWMSETWPSNWKQPAGGLIGIGLLAAGLSGIQSENKKTPVLRFLNRSGDRKQALLFAVLGAANIVAAWWPRPWRDYEWATGWSSGLKGTSEPPSRYSGQWD